MRRTSANEFRDRDASPPKGDEGRPPSADADRDSTDGEMEGLQRQAEALRTELQVRLSTLLSSGTFQKALPDALSLALATRCQAQEAYNQQCLYRTCAGLTTFKVKDPDPNAVDGGAVLGVRIEVMSRAKFLHPYFVLLNRPYAGPVGRRYLAVHRHTVPVCIPLAGLAARHLPGPPRPEALARPEAEGGEDPRDRRPQGQDLAKFARALRIELVRYHNRMAVVADLRKAVGLGDARREDALFTDISPADAEMKQVTLQWDDGRTGRLVMDGDGTVETLVVYRDGACDGETARRLLGLRDSVRAEEVAKRLAAGTL